LPSNYDHSFERNGKTIFVQNEDGYSHGKKLLNFIEANVIFPDYCFHYQKGGHVAALHPHLEAAWFFRVDFKDFFYSISRNRVSAALHAAGFRKARTFAKWSCVRNPIAGGPTYSLPIGFVQSSALATMVLLRTNIVHVLSRAAASGVYISIYLDDLIGSGSDLNAIQTVFDDLIEACASRTLKSVSASSLNLPPSL
jgi:Reverse transcriptase (RNA-dependent DNA polymerase)